MITVIIAGGAGTRLWPLSTPNNPKQLLTLTSERTMVQQAYDRASRLGIRYILLLNLVMQINYAINFQNSLAMPF